MQGGVRHLTVAEWETQDEDRSAENVTVDFAWENKQMQKAMRQWGKQTKVPNTGNQEAMVEAQKLKVKYLAVGKCETQKKERKDEATSSVDIPQEKQQIQNAPMQAWKKQTGEKMKKPKAKTSYNETEEAAVEAVPQKPKVKHITLVEEWDQMAKMMTVHIPCAAGGGTRSGQELPARTCAPAASASTTPLATSSSSRSSDRPLGDVTLADMAFVPTLASVGGGLDSGPWQSPAPAKYACPEEAEGGVGEKVLWGQARGLAGGVGGLGGFGKGV
ncbi:hypothetical protein M427DRAFT_68694 [Gonapodya prolifera JEL478]|uniref:Uncharacterized protein n=1 Tax=Gonapodya prolifera (strain JEL478) TaxID=1344416 RepID=A0A139AKG3_GONPJ|nr:hypothetical protein M427DRAFT_68694 [Gonapodya prolifera JEL478]|eukprot:KXS16925.1 hypothetical protein M427DRAFT_68694 [Gonapodya prolifera JEL478]